MQGHKAKNFGRVFNATANRGSYKNRPILQPRGGVSNK